MDQLVENLRALLNASDPNAFAKKSVTDPQTGFQTVYATYAELLDAYDRALALQTRESMAFRPVYMGRGNRGGI